MSRLDRAVQNSGNYAFCIKYKPGFPFEVFSKTNPFSDKKKVLLSEIIHPDDYMPFCGIVEDIIGGKVGKLKAHVRLKSNGEYCWFFMSAAAEHPMPGATDFIGMMFDVTEYLECESEDAVMHRFRTKMKEMMDADREQNLVDILGEDYLGLIQQPFTHIKGLYSAIVDNKGRTIASAHLQDKRVNLNKMSYQRKKDICVNHRVCASWIIAGESLEDINENLPLLEILVQTVSEIANSYVVIGEEIENSQNANKMLGENFEDQIFINNVYSLTLRCETTSASFAKIIPMIEDYFGLDRIVYSADEEHPAKIYRWNEAGEFMRAANKFAENSSIDELLESNAVAFTDENELYGASELNRSCAVSSVVEGGKTRGRIVYVSNQADRTWSNRDRKILKNITSILSTLIYRSFMENDLMLSQEHLERLAYTDRETGVPNESAFERDLREKGAKSEACSIIAVEISNYKSMSETFGYQYAGELIKSVAEYISAVSVHARKMVYRYSEDIILATLDGGDRGETMTLARTILGKFRSPWFLNEAEHRLEMYSGVVFYPDDVIGFSDCTKAVTRTLRLAKERKSHEPIIYSVGLEEKLDENLRIRKLIIDAVENDFRGFYFLYTPIVSLRTGEITSCEGRMFCAGDDLLVAADRILPVAERFGLAGRVYEFAMRKLCEFCANARESGLRDFKIGFDIPQSFLSSDSCVLTLKQALAEYSLPPSAAIVITSESSGTLAKSNVNLIQMNALGINIIADDKPGVFLTEAVLDNPCVKYIKLSMRRLWGDDISAAYMRSFIEKAHGRGIKVCIKGIDNPKLLETAASFGIDFIQGIVNGRPMRSGDFFGKIALKQSAE